MKTIYSEIWQILRKVPGITPAEISDLLGADIETVRKYLAELTRSGRICQDNGHYALETASDFLDRAIREIRRELQRYQSQRYIRIFATGVCGSKGGTGRPHRRAGSHRHCSAYGQHSCWPL